MDMAIKVRRLEMDLTDLDLFIIILGRKMACVRVRMSTIMVIHE